MTLPAIETVQVAVKATQHYLNRLAASRAGGPQVDFTDGTVIVGDGNGAPPAISDLVTAGGVTHEVGRGQWVHGVSVNPQNAAQTDIFCVIPAASGDIEIGPFWVTEFAITDENGDVCLVGTTVMAKFVSTVNGAAADLAWIAAESESNGEVVLTPPSAAFVTIYDVMLAINAHQPTATAPLTMTDSVSPLGWLVRVFGLRAARQPKGADATPAVAEPDASGYGRPATQAEFDAGESLGGFAWPWATLAQIKAALDFIVGMIPTIPGVVAPITYDAQANKYGAAKASAAQVRAGTDDAVVVTPAALAQSAALLQLPDAPTINWNLASGYNARVTLAGNRTLAAPTNAQQGVTYSLVLQQDATGGRTLAFNPVFKWGAAGAPALSTGANKRDLVTMLCVSGAPTPEFICSIVKGF